MTMVESPTVPKAFEEAMREEPRPQAARGGGGFDGWKHPYDRGRGRGDGDGEAAFERIVAIAALAAAGAIMTAALIQTAARKRSLAAR